MKTKLLLLAGALVALGFSGCASGLVGAAATKIEASAPSGEKLSITLPKEYETKNLKILFNPATKQFELTSDTLRASNQGLVNSAAQAQAEATGKALDLAAKLGDRVLGPRP